MPTRAPPRQAPLSTFSIDVDTGSYTISRRKLNEGRTPPAASVRVEEFVNYFRSHYPPPPSDGEPGEKTQAERDQGDWHGDSQRDPNRCHDSTGPGNRCRTDQV